MRVREVGSPATTLLGGGLVRTAEIVATLRPHEAIVQYQPAGDSLLIFVARREGVRSIAVALPRGGLSSRVRLARELIASRDGSSSRARPALRGLHDLLIAPARRSGALDGVRDLAIVPHGVLAYLPFAALMDSGGRWLAQDYVLVTLPSAASLAALRARPAMKARLLPWCSRRIRGAAGDRRRSRGGGAVAARRGSAAGYGSERAGGAGGAGLGGGWCTWRPTASSTLGTRCSPGSRRRPSRRSEDGRIEVHEILGLRVRSPLVFLSGCETGLGTAGSTGLPRARISPTLARAFLYAGAHNVVATLWRVDDAGAAAFATEFYRRLRQAGPIEALAGTQRAMAADGRYAAPYYWAGYAVAGDGRTVANIGTAPSEGHANQELRFGTIRLFVPPVAIPPDIPGGRSAIAARCSVPRVGGSPRRAFPALPNHVRRHPCALVSPFPLCWSSLH